MKKVQLIFFLGIILFLSACGKATSGNDTTSGESANAASGDYPSKPIEILVPFEPGGSTDTAARVLAKYLPKYLPNEVDIVVVNQAGAGGTIAATNLYHAEPDGYTLELATHRSIAMQPLYGETEYQHDSFQPIGKVMTNQQVLVVSADAPYDTFEEWMKYVKNNPGEFKYGVSGGIGSGSHLPMAELSDMAGLEMEPIAFDGTSPAMTALLGGNIDGAVGQPDSVKGFVEEGDMKIIFNAASTPIPYAEDVPLLIDEGFDIAYDSNASLLAPEELPEEIIDILSGALEEALQDPDVQAELEAANIQIDHKGPDGVQEELNEENAKIKNVLEGLGII